MFGKNLLVFAYILWFFFFFTFKSHVGDFSCSGTNLSVFGEIFWFLNPFLSIFGEILWFHYDCKEFGEYFYSGKNKSVFAKIISQNFLVVNNFSLKTSDIQLFFLKTLNFQLFFLLKTP